MKTQIYIVDTTRPVTTASPSGGTYHHPQTVTLTCNDGNGSGCAVIYYTTDGSTPGVGKQTYSSPLNIATTTTLQFMARDNAGNSEAVKTEIYTVVNTLSVTVNGTGGTVTSSPSGISCGSDCSETYNYGTSVTLTASPDTRYDFTGWSGSCAGTGTTCALAMDEAKNVTASFANTFFGTNVKVDLGNVKVTFASVTISGQTTATEISCNGSPAGYRFSGHCYDIRTTATYSGEVTVTIAYDPGSLPSGTDGNSLKMFHYENGAWNNVTFSVDIGNNTVTAKVSHLSPFGNGYPSSPSTGANIYMIAFLAICAISAGSLLTRRNIRTGNGFFSK